MSRQPFKGSSRYKVYRQSSAFAAAREKPSQMVIARQGTGRGNLPEGAHVRLRRLCGRTSGCPRACRHATRPCTPILRTTWKPLWTMAAAIRSGLPISSARSESSVDDIANARMGKRRRMRWRQKGLTALPSQGPLSSAVAYQWQTPDTQHDPHVLPTPHEIRRRQWAVGQLQLARHCFGCATEPSRHAPE